MPLEQEAFLNAAISDAATSQISAVAHVQQGFNSSTSYTLYPASAVTIRPIRLCEPRHQDGLQPPPNPFAIDAALVAKLQTFDEKVTGWLSQDSANPTLFMGDPVSALKKAGVELSSAEWKALQNGRRAVENASMVPPGAKITSLEASVASRGAKLPVDSGCACGNCHQEG